MNHGGAGPVGKDRCHLIAISTCETSAFRPRCHLGELLTLNVQVGGRFVNWKRKTMCHREQ